MTCVQIGQPVPLSYASTRLYPSAAPPSVTIYDGNYGYQCSLSSSIVSGIGLIPEGLSGGSRAGKCCFGGWKFGRISRRATL